LSICSTFRNKRAAAIVLGCALVATACFGTTSESGLPELEIEFPARSAPGSVRTAEFTITNAGPEAMPTLVVAFTRVGNFTPIVDAGFRGRNPAIKAVRPQPNNVSEGGVEYFFDGLGVGESTTIEFDLVIPDAEGPAANSVTVYDGSDVERVSGSRLETSVE
jgi:hypothetical protein